MQPIHAKIKQQRKKLRLTQKEMADCLHVNQSTYSLIEAGVTKIDIDRLLVISEKLNTPLNELAGITSSVPGNPQVPGTIEDLKRILAMKDEQIRQLLQQNNLLMSQIELILLEA